MSFLGGPECSTGANPLAQFQKQTSADNALQRDRLTSRPPQLNGFRTQAQQPGDAAFQDFQHPGPQFNESLPNEAFHIEQLRREQEHLERVGGGGGGGNGWAGEFGQIPEALAQQQQQGGHAHPFNPQDFAQFRQSQLGSPLQRNASPAAAVSSFQQPQSGYRPSMYSGGGLMQSRMPMMGSMYHSYDPQFAQQQPGEQGVYEGKGKGRVQELSDTDWERQFEELSTEDREAEMEELEREAERAVERELDGVDSNLLASDDYAEHLGDAYEQWKDFDGSVHDFDGLRTHRGPELGNYMFEENNLFRDVPNAFEEGLQIMRDGGNLSLAALAFEAAVQKQSDFTDAWVALGQAQAQNEKEAPAIRALEQALKLDPDNLDALMGLSVSYTNEGYDSLAYRTLERWVGVKYPQLGLTSSGITAEAAAEEEMGFTDRHQLHEKVTNLFLEAAQLNPDGVGVDVDVQVGLGVLFYGSEDYDKAVDCFSAALESSQHGALKKEGEEHLLWNRLGATLANGGKSEEAIEAYTRALEIQPNFVRARYNLGVSCINLGVLDVAAGHLLSALSMHRVLESEGRAKAAELLRGGGGGDVVDDGVVEGLLQQNQSTNLYDTLRRVFTQMGRRDLGERVGPDMDLDALRGEFDF